MSDYPSSFGNIVPSFIVDHKEENNLLLKKIEDLTTVIEDLQERVTALEYNPGPGGPKYQEAKLHYENIKD